MATRSGARRCVGLVLLCLQVRLSEVQSARVSANSDALLPYTEGHGPPHSGGLVTDGPVAPGRTTFETWPSSSDDALPVAKSTVFISDMPGGSGGSRWVYGHMTVVRDPLRTLSVLEPGGPGGCERGRRATVEETAKAAGCLYAQNAGFFNTTSDRCLGNVVSDGRMVRDGGGVRNAQFGIRKDGSLVFGYLSQRDVSDPSNPFVQLVSGAVWLLRDGEVYINQSLKAESDQGQDAEVFRRFLDVLSARTAVGHDADGNLVLFHVDGRTEQRGMNLWEVAEFLKKHGVINAINLDGGGSSSFVINGTLASYPPDQCASDSRWRCARAVSTILCVHGRRCQNCSEHGVCVDGRCRCHDGWGGDACDSRVCRPPACGPHGVCTAGGCVCAAGWRGETCNQECLPGYHGDGCRQRCSCLNGASCDHVGGRCLCPPGFHGNFCEQGGQRLAEQMFKLRTEQEEAHRDKPYLTEKTWLLITATLASLLLIRRAVQLTRASWRWFHFRFSYIRVPPRDVRRKSVCRHV